MGGGGRGVGVGFGQGWDRAVSVKGREEEEHPFEDTVKALAQLPDVSLQISWFKWCSIGVCKLFRG